MIGSEKLPTWDLSPIYPDFDSDEYRAAKTKVAALAAEAVAFYGQGCTPDPGEDAGKWLKKALAMNDELGSLSETLSAYAYARYSTATRDQTALAELNAIEELILPAKKADVLYRNALAARKEALLALFAEDPKLRPYAFHVGEELFFQSKQMSPEMEDLAEDLGRSGADSWSRLQESVSSNSSAMWDEATGEKKTAVELRNLAFDPDRKVREKAYHLELSIWKSVE
ncbi:MAG TPA: peptidase M3, partial [Rectinemataceae bacterium]|nr:peptidase M3 [Rectinemataceae bacterium]